MNVFYLRKFKQQWKTLPFKLFNAIIIILALKAICNYYYFVYLGKNWSISVQFNLDRSLTLVVFILVHLLLRFPFKLHRTFWYVWLNQSKAQFCWQSFDDDDVEAYNNCCFFFYWDLMILQFSQYLLNFVYRLISIVVEKNIGQGFINLNHF